MAKGADCPVKKREHDRIVRRMEKVQDVARHELQRQIVKTQEDRDWYKGCYDNMSKAFTAAIEEKGVLASKLAMATNDRDRRAQQLSKAHGRIEELESRLSVAVDEMVKLSDKHQELVSERDEILSGQTPHNELVGQNMDLEERLRYAREKVDNFDQIIGLLSDQRNELMKKNNEQRKRIADTLDQCSKQSAQIVNLQLRLQEAKEGSESE